MPAICHDVNVDPLGQAHCLELACPANPAFTECFTLSLI